MQKANQAQRGDVLVCRDVHHGFLVLDAITGEFISGPFSRLEYANGAAQSLAWNRHGRVLQERDECQTES